MATASRDIEEYCKDLSHGISEGQGTGLRVEIVIQLVHFITV